MVFLSWALELIYRLRYSRGLAHVDAGRGRVRALRDGEVDADAPAVDLHAAALVLGDLRVLLRLEVQEAEAA